MRRRSDTSAGAVWTLRRRRVERLREEHPPAAELLGFYGDLLALQEPLHRKALGSRWLDAVETSDGREPRLRLGRLPARRLVRAFSRFVRDVPSSATDLLRGVAARLEAAPAARSKLLDAALAGDGVDAAAAELDCDPAALEFFPRAFIQPIAEAAASRPAGASAVGAAEPADGSTPADGSADARASCPCCGAAPLAAVLRDEPEVKGRRTLLCSLCLTEWTFPRTRCPACGEERAERRPHHLSESWPHVRVEECGSCRTYLKAVDLRAAGLAVPVVDELASVELDLWAGEQGLEKRQRNLLGM